MKIPKEILKIWKPLVIRGDQKEMAKGDEQLRKAISTAMNGGECTEEIFITARDFYNARIELLNTALPHDKRRNIIPSKEASADGTVLR